MTAVLNDTTLSSDEKVSYGASIYVGPQNSAILKSYSMDLEKIQVYFRYGFFDSIAKIIEDLIKLVHKFIPNWGVSIILVSLMIYFSFYPLTMKSMMSMRKMQSLQPKIMELREKHEKNPQKLNQEIMKLYSENKVNPLGGCFPLLLQMPIFICLYQMIWRSILFKNASFLWIKDLSEPDRFYVMTKSFPVIGNEINILPFIIIVLMILQQRLSSKNMNVMDPNQLAQQKMMMFMLPVFLFLVFYRIASGLTLYFTVFYVVSLFTQLHISKKVKA
jgi:YidC/Oxa1 family membrane protein insertase